jgi:hypothetical protein
MLVATTAQVHDIIVWRGHVYQLVGVQGEGFRDLTFAVADKYLVKPSGNGRRNGRCAESQTSGSSLAEGVGLEPTSPFGQRFSSYEHGVLTLPVMA